MDIRNYKAYIVYRPNRLDNVKKLQEIFPKNELILGYDLNEISEELKLKYLDIKYYHRIPNKHMKHDLIIKRAHYSRFFDNLLNKLSHKEPFEPFIYLEDDAEFIGDNYMITLKDEPIYYLGGFIMNKTKIWCLHAVLFNSKEFIDKYLEYCDNPKHFKQYDYMLADFIYKNNIDQGYDLKFIQKESYDTKQNSYMNKLMYKTAAKIKSNSKPEMTMKEPPYKLVEIPKGEDEDFLETILSDIYEELEETKFKMNIHRKKNAGIGYTASYGIVCRRPKKKGEVLKAVMSVESKKNSFLDLLLSELADYYKIKYTTVQVNKNYTTLPHKDIANDEDSPSYLISLGVYDGGLLCFEDGTKVDANGRMISFYGSKLVHWNEPHSGGNKYSLVFYRNKRVVKMLAKELKAI